MKKSLFGALCAAAIAITSATPMAASAQSTSLTLTDRLYQPYVKEYWTWAFNQPQETNPLLGNAPFCKRSADGTTTFLAGTFEDGALTRACTIAPLQRLYLSILSGLYIAFESDAPETKTYPEMLAAADCPDATGKVTIDGFFTFDITKSYTKTNIFDFPVVEGGVLASMLGDEETDGAVAAGLHVMLAPLFRGNHTVRWQAESKVCELVKDITYNLKVQ